MFTPIYKVYQIMAQGFKHINYLSINSTTLHVPLDFVM